MNTGLPRTCTCCTCCCSGFAIACSFTQHQHTLEALTGKPTAASPFGFESAASKPDQPLSQHSSAAFQLQSIICTNLKQILGCTLQGRVTQHLGQQQLNRQSRGHGKAGLKGHLGLSLQPWRPLKLSTAGSSRVSFDVHAPCSLKKIDSYQHIAVLCCAVLCCAVLCCAVLCCAVVCCAVLCWQHSNVTGQMSNAFISPIYICSCMYLT